jgi:steroid 5-alpha reductase family enzyme
MVAFGWTMVAQVWAAALVLIAVVFWLVTEDDPALEAELALITTEAAWQLRLVARHVRHGWAVTGADTPPAWLEDWLRAVDEVCDPCSGIDVPAEAALSG